MNKPRINLALNRALADDLNINIRDLSDELLTWFGGDRAGSFNQDGYRYDIRVRAEATGRDDPEKLKNTLVRTNDGQLIRAEGLISSSIGMSPNVIKKIQQAEVPAAGGQRRRRRSRRGYPDHGRSIQKYALRTGRLPLRRQGIRNTMKESFYYMSIALIFAIILVYMVMAIQFESFIHPFTVMFSLPLMTAGSFGLLALAGLRISVMSFMGIILLVGVVVNNAILLVDFINQLRAKGMNKIEAVLEADRSV